MGLLDRIFGALTGGAAGQAQLRVTLNQREAALQCLTKLVHALEESHYPMTKALYNAELGARLRVGIAPRPSPDPSAGCDHGYARREHCSACALAEARARIDNFIACRDAAFEALKRAGLEGESMSTMIDTLTNQRDHARRQLVVRHPLP
jgi:hypothetical protein